VQWALCNAVCNAVCDAVCSSHCAMLCAMDAVQELDLRGFSERLGDWGLSVLLASAAPHMTKVHG